MPIRPGKDFLSRCISEMSHKHPDWDNKRVVAACYSMQRQQSGDSAIMMDERSVIDPASIRTTSDGYLVCMPRIARTGVQVYAGYEVGRPDLDEVRVYRPPEEVFDEAAMRSYAHRPVTLEHPPEPVTAANWRKFAVGQTGAEVAQDGKFVRVPMLVMDAEAIKVVRDGKEQLSNSYGCNLDWQDGVSPDGEKYDAVQRVIRGNHLAIVSSARGGADLRIGDAGSWDPEKHPRHPSGSAAGGEFAPGGHGTPAGRERSEEEARASTDLRRLRGQVEQMRALLNKPGRTSKGAIELREKIAKNELEIVEIEQFLKNRRPLTLTVVDPYKRDSADALAADDLGNGSDNIGDSDMSKTIVVDGISCEVSDTAAQVVQRTLDSLNARVKEISDSFEEYKKKKKEEEEDSDRKTKDAAAKHATEVATKDAEIARLARQVADSAVTPDKLDQMVKDRGDLIAKAKVYLGDGLVVAGKSDDDIRRQVVLSHVGDAAKDWDAGQLKTSFISITAKMPAEQLQGDSVYDAARTLGQPSVSALADAEKAYNERNHRLSDAWKPKAVA